MALAGLFKPEYILRPTQPLRRLYWAAFEPRTGKAVVALPWDTPIEVDVEDDLGRALMHLGVYDLAVSEVIWRLCDQGETALDIGANIGYVTALLARRVGKAGRVLCFEAHPEIAEELRCNVARWSDLPDTGQIQTYDVALSDREGCVWLEMPPEFSHNRGTGRIARDRQRSNGNGLSVRCSTLDSFLVDLSEVGVAKMDVEGHEESVLQGARRVLQARSVRDWVFEHQLEYPSPVTTDFANNGYTLFQIARKFFGPVLVDASKPTKPSAWEPSSYLATVDPERALRRLSGRGWRCLG